MKKSKKVNEPKIQICKECKHEYDLNETKRVFTGNVALSGCCSAYCYTQNLLAEKKNDPMKEKKLYCLKKDGSLVECDNIHTHNCEQQYELVKTNQ